MSPFYCVKERKPCVRWVEKYFKDCLCNMKDEISFTFGITSLVCWGVAEIPQIITIFHTKKSHGVSLVFLLTWVAGSARSLAGSGTPPWGTYMRAAKSGPSAMEYISDSSEDEAPPLSSKHNARPIPRPVA
ncbi:unnamed protein product, partial [Sphenostylis stenocarpa]